MERVIEFLIRAKKATYAGKGAETAPSRPGSHDLEYAAGTLKYIGTYLGGEKFAGEEAIWENNATLWAMNYVGRVTGKDFSGDFLKESLSRVAENKPYRGPEHYESGDYIYKCKIDGNFHWFQGYEEIFYKGNKVYECFFHGGDIK